MGVAQGQKNGEIGALTPAVHEEEGGHRARLGAEGVRALEIVAGVGVILGVDNGARHAPAVLRDAEVADGAVAAPPQRRRRRDHKAVLLHHEARLRRRRGEQQHQQQQWQRTRPPKP